MKRRNSAPLALLALAAAGQAWSAIAYSRFAHPKGDYVIEYPSDWKQAVGLEMLELRPPGLSGSKVRVSLARYPVGSDSPAKPEAFIDGLMKQAGAIKRLDSRQTIFVSEKKAEWLALTRTVGKAMKEIDVVIPHKEGYYVLKLAGIGDAYQKALPEFNRIVSSLKIGP